MENGALVVIDLQVGVESKEKKLYQLDQVLKRVNERIAEYRRKSLPIIFVQHEEEGMLVGSSNWQLFPELDAREEDHYIRKTHANSFFQTELKSLLDSLSIEALELCGAQTEYCVDTTIRVAHGLGYSLSMRRGTATTVDNDCWLAPEIIAHHEAIWDNRFLRFF